MTEEKDKKADSGSVWTSYSDMFTTMAIIFLVMFVFALLRSGVSSIQAIAEKKKQSEIIQGKVPEKLKKLGKERNKKIATTLREMGSLENEIAKKMQSINSFMSKVETHKKVIREMIKEQETREAIMINLKGKLEKKETSITKHQNQLKELENLRKKELTANNDKLVRRDEKITQQKTMIENLLVQELNLGKDLDILKKQLDDLNFEKIEQNRLASKNINLLKERIQNYSEEKKNLEFILEKEIQEKANKIAEIEQLENNLNNLENNLETEVTKKKQTESRLKESKLKITQTMENIKNLEGLLMQEKNRRLDQISNNNDLQSKIDNLKISLNNQVSIKKDLEHQLTSYKEIINQTNKKVNDLENNLKSAGHKKNTFLAKINLLEEQLKGSQQDVLNFEQKLSIQKQKERELYASYQNMAGKNKILEIKLNDLGQKFASEQKKNNDLSNLFTKIQNERAQASIAQAGATGNEKGIDDRLAQSQNAIEKKNQEIGRLKALNQNLNNDLSKINRGMASVQSTLRKNIAKELASKMQKANLNVEVDPVTGSIILRMDDAFLFKRNDSKLNRKARNTLKKIIPLYSEILFGNKNISKKIDSINIIGHASPSYKNKYVYTFDNKSRAYNYNLDLSTNRAKAIVKYIFGYNFIKFPNKNIFRTKVAAIGKSYSEPIMVKKKRKRRKKVLFCGKYDCKKSRRVEISFTLNEDINAWKNFNSKRPSRRKP